MFPPQKSNIDLEEFIVKTYKGLFVISLVLAFASMSFADDMFIVTDIAGVGVNVSQNYDHQDADPFKGSADVTVTNTGTEPWGDFHFELYDPIGGQDLSNLYFLDAGMGGVDPTSSQSSTTWIINNLASGAILDLYFYSDPVLPGEIATFSVYTDNTADQLPWFGLMIHPTPVPEPATMILLGMGGVLLRRKK